ncbi:MAG TPA: site-2 protease family protein [Fulvivirga sp.]|nr:site-2 protease family protein [Fulvivirga sp.]
MDDKLKTTLKHLGLFIITFITASIAGTGWINGNVWPYTPYSWDDFVLGMGFSIPFLLILTVHEFGHYFMAKYHKVKTSLPYYIPMPPFPLSIGTMGAVIRIREHIKSKKIHFDIGIAGPLAGFVVAIALLTYGYATLPSLDYLFKIHPEYAQYGDDYADHVYTYEFQKEQSLRLYQEARVADSLEAVQNGEIKGWSFPPYEEQASYPNVSIGKPLLVLFLENFAPDKKLIPNANELMHYPLLMAGFLSLLFTALNLMPIGQLDGGHVLYGLVGTHWHRKIATAVFIAFLLYAGLGYVTPFDGFESLLWNVPLYIGFLYIALRGLKKSTQETLMYALIIFTVQFLTPFVFPHAVGYSGWLFFALLVGRFLGVYHPPAPIEEPLDFNRKVLGWLSLFIFIISFSPTPFIFG